MKPVTAVLFLCITACARRVDTGAPAAPESIPASSAAIRSPAAALLADYRRDAIRKLVTDPRSPLDSAGVFALRYFAYNDTFDLGAVFRPSTDTSLFRFPTSDGGSRDYRIFGQLRFRLGDETYALDVFELPGLQRHPLYFDHLFLPFFDATNGGASYGGGRYIDLRRSAFAAGDYRLDFNKAYNPWCAYGDGYSCPVPPMSNALPFPVYAGEAAFGGPGHGDAPSAP